MTKLIAITAFVVTLVGSALAKELKPAQVTFDKFKNVTRITTDRLDHANADKVMIRGRDASVLIRSIGLSASLVCEGQVDKCTPAVVELLFIGSTADWTMKCDHINLLIDGHPERVPASWDGQVLSGEDLREYIDTNPSPELLVKLANAKTVDVQIGSFDFSLADVGIAALKDLVTHIDGIVLVPPTPTAEPTPTPVSREKLATDRKAWLDTVNAPGRKGRGEIKDDILTLHTAECNQQNFDTLVANPHMKQVFANLRIKKFIYTNDLDLTLVYEVQAPSGK